MKLFYALLLSLCSFCVAEAQSNFWQDFEESSIMLSQNSEVDNNVRSYRTLSLDFDGLKSALSVAPLEFTAAAESNPVQLYLPLPDGSMELMEVVESPVFAPELQEKYPNIRSFAARSVNSRLVSARLDYSPRGFNAIIFSPSGQSFISTYASNQTRFYNSYYLKNMQTEMPTLACGFDDFEEEMDLNLLQQEMLSMQTELSFRNNEEVPLRQYRMALVCTGNYGGNANTGGGSVASVLATYNTALNLLNAIFQVEFAVRFELIPESEDFIFLDPDDDPFINANMGSALLEQNKNFLNTQLPISSYDIGHIFTGNCTDVGGVAQGTVCSENKARGVTCHNGANSLSYVITRILAHEVGHQFSCGHSWNFCPPSEEQLSPPNAFEPGSGSTIMSYKDLCGSPHDIGGPFGLYYNIGSLEDAIFFSRQGDGSVCGETISTDNNQPVITLDYEDGFYIPVSTPFELEGSAEDLNNDDLTYCWEQYNTGPSTSMSQPFLNAPLFRSFDPTTESKRVFPRLDKIINNSFNLEEVLPTYSRDMNFRLTVRDNNPDYGGAVWEEVAFEADETAGPFVVTYPTNSESFTAGDYPEVTWEVANTTNTRVNCQYVNILLSTDGGFTYPITLVENTANDGSAFVSIPNVETSNARIRIEASENIFFDISNQNSSISPPAEPTYVFDVSPASIPLYCVSSDPLTFDISTEALLGYDMPITLSLSGDLPSGATADFDANTINPGDNASLTIDLGNYSGRDTFELQVEGLTDDLGTFSREIRFIAVSTDFSALAMTNPANGTNGIFLSTDFSWTDIPGAESYDIEIATSPSFGSTILESAEGLTEANYTPEELFDNNQLYFWRVRANNICGSGDFLTPFAFYTTAVDCNTSDPNDLPISIPTNPNSRESKIFVTESGAISDVNIAEVNIAFLPINSLEIRLISPAGTEVLVYDNECLNTGNLNLAFDDEATTDIICPPINGNPMRPANPLSAFIGEETQGEWTLRVTVTAAGFGSGNINDWALEFCSTTTPESPTLLRNETLEVPPGEGNPITNDLLEVSDPSTSASGLKYVLITVPENGSLFRASDSEPLTVGESFTQQTINSFNISYVHDGSATDTDEFVFVVDNGQGALLSNQTFNIEIDEGAVVNTNNLKVDNTMEIFPNPAQNLVNVRLQKPLLVNASVRLLNIQGQAIQRYALGAGQQQLEMNTSTLADGVYLIELNTANGMITQKLIIQK